MNIQSTLQLQDMLINHVFFKINWVIRQDNYKCKILLEFTITTVKEH